MKTTVQIPDSLLAEAQKLATRERTTLKALIAEALRRLIDERKREKPFRLQDGSVGGEGLTPEFQNASWEQLRDLLYEGRGA